MSTNPPLPPSPGLHPQDEPLYRTILDTLHEGVLILDEEGRVMTCNPSVERILGLTRNQLAGRASVDPNFFGAVDEEGHPIPDEGHPSRLVLRTGRPCLGAVHGVRNGAGELKWIRVNAQPLTDPGHRPRGVVVSIADITTTKGLETRLRQEAYHDELTGLYNRRYFGAELVRSVNAARRHGHAMSLCVCDLDRFKSINDTFGHGAGDRALQAFAEAILLELRQDELAARLGGDEFVLLYAHSPAKNATVSLERIRANVASLQIQTEDGRNFPMTASFGIADFDPAMDHEYFLEAADRVLYRAKDGGRNRVEVNRG